MRLNKPKVPAGADIFKSVGQDWTLYKLQSEEDHYKLVANREMQGSANYPLVIRHGRIQKTLSHHKLKTERPDLYGDVERACGGPEQVSEAKDDIYGDFEIRRDNKLTTEQRWNRRLVLMRIAHIENFFCNIKTDIPLMVLAHYRGVHGPENLPSYDAIAEVERYLNRGEMPQRDEFEAILRAYYDGEYKPRHMETLIVNLDIAQGVF